MYVEITSVTTLMLQLNQKFLHYPFKIPEWCPKKDMEVHERGENDEKTGT
jgi:hypothetical protein